MTPEDIRDINEAMNHIDYWKNLKSGNLYRVEKVTMESTNCREGTPHVIFNKINFTTCEFNREYHEFMEKFKPTSVMEILSEKLNG